VGRSVFEKSRCSEWPSKCTALASEKRIQTCFHNYPLSPGSTAKVVVLLLFLRCWLPGLAQQTAGLSLHDAIVQAQQSSLAHQGQDQVDAAQGLVVQAGLRPNPVIHIQSEDLRPGAKNFDFPNQTEDGAYFGQLFEFGGKRARRLDLAHANLHQAQAERDLILQQIAGRVAAAYWTAVASDGIAHLLETDMTAVDEIVRYNKERVDAGAMAGVDLLRVQIERDRLLLALEAARRETVLARIELYRQIGTAPPDQIQLSGQLNSFRPVQAESLATVLSARADVVLAREAVTAAEADLHLQHSLGVPDLEVFGGYKRNNGLNTAYTSLQIPLTFRNRNQGQVERAQASGRLAQDRLRQLDIVVAAEINSAQEAYQRQQAVIQTILPDMRERAKKNLAILDDAYRTGGVDLLRYLDAERTEFDVEVSALRTLAEFQQAVVRLQLAYGVQP
jgi:cobalt-zinc-cadmium efflux system outer membrane protein